jgi:3-oxoacyl-[acyl-carrier protein] reductase
MALAETTQHTPLAVVTGSTTGIGLAIARQLASGGYRVVVHGGHSQQRVDAAVSTVGHGAVGVCADISNELGRQQLCEQVETLGPVDLWVNNAGTDVLTGEAVVWSFEQKLAALWHVDVLGTMVLSRHIGAAMCRQGRGAIINIGWDQAEVGMAGDSGEMFAATKGAIMAFTKSLAKSLAPAVRVNCIAPGWIRTKWGDSANDYWNERAKSESLARRWGTPEDVAALVLFLASPQSAFINGQVIALNGGFAASADRGRQQTP